MLSLLLPVLAFAITTQATRPADFVEAAKVVDNLSVKMMYAGSENFVGRPIAGYKQNVCWLTKAAAAELNRAAERLKAYGQEHGGRALHFEARDCYRPQKATEDFRAWGEDQKSPGNKAEFFPGIDKFDIVHQHYLSMASGHSRGSTIDLTIIDATNSAAPKELDMGTRVDFLGPESRTANPDLSADQKENRALLGRVMGPRFENYSKEWWHFTLRDEPYPHTYFDFDVD